MPTRWHKRERRMAIFQFVRRTIILRFLVAPFAKTTWCYGPMGCYDEIYIFGIRVIAWYRR
jgi:hypothetical protein